MYPKTVRGNKYCCESIRINGKTTTRSHGRCKSDIKTACETCNYNKYLKNKGKNTENKLKNILKWL